MLFPPESHVNRTFVIAEAGSCHDNEWGKAVELILTAKRVGADACKFQFWSNATRLAERRHASAYLGVYHKYQLPVEWLPLLKAQCDHAGIEFMTTCYLPEDIPVVAPLVKRFKVASFEAGDEAFLKAHGGYGKPLIVSTGMFDGSEWPRQLPQTELLHCVSAYPTPLDQANLGALRLGYSGYSDHTACTLTGGFAVCAGARILEVHFRLATTDTQNPDYTTALSPYELHEYVANVRLAERMLGDGVKRPQACEAPMSAYRVRP